MQTTVGDRASPDHSKHWGHRAAVCLLAALLPSNAILDTQKGRSLASGAGKQIAKPRCHEASSASEVLPESPMPLNTKRQETTIAELAPASFCPDKVAAVHSTTEMNLCDKQMPTEHPRLFYTASAAGGWQQFWKQGMHLIFQAHRASSSQQAEYTSNCVLQDLPSHVPFCVSLPT